MAYFICEQMALFQWLFQCLNANDGVYFRRLINGLRAFTAFLCRSARTRDVAAFALGYRDRTAFRTPTLIDVTLIPLLHAPPATFVPYAIRHLPPTTAPATRTTFRAPLRLLLHLRGSVTALPARYDRLDLLPRAARHARACRTGSRFYIHALAPPPLPAIFVLLTAHIDALYQLPRLPPAAHCTGWFAFSAFLRRHCCAVHCTAVPRFARHHTYSIVRLFSRMC